MVMLERIASKIAGKRDVLTPRDWRGENIDVWVKAGILRPLGFAPEDYICIGCTNCDKAPVPRQKRTVGAEPGFYVRCAETGEFIDVSSKSIAKYAIEVESFASLFASALQCQKMKPADDLHDVWDCGETGEAFSNRRRRVWFFRRFDSASAKLLNELPSGSQGAIIVAAKVVKDYDESAFPFVFAASELMPNDNPVVSLEPVRIRFKADTERRRQEKKNLRKQDTDLENNLKLLAKYYKDNAIALIRKMKNNWYEAVSATKEITQQKAAAKIHISDSRVSDYLNSGDYENNSWAVAARFWHKMCADLQQLSIVADIIRTDLHHKSTTIDEMDAVQLYLKIYRFYSRKTNQQKTGNN